MDTQKIRNTLENSELFKGLEETDLKRISDLCRSETYKGGEYIFHQGDSGKDIFIIIDGYVFLERSVDFGKRRGKAIIGSFGKGKAFGCWSTILDDPHTLMSSAVCKNDTEVIRMKGSDLRSVMLSDPGLGFKIMEKICFLLRDRIQGVLGAMEKI